MKHQRAETDESRCAVIFVRAPQIGRVKTRLSKSIGNERSLRLYQAFVQDVIETVARHTADIFISYYPNHQEAMVRHWLGESFHYLPQKGETLGEKMRHAFQERISRIYPVQSLTRPSQN